MDEANGGSQKAVPFDFADGELRDFPECFKGIADGGFVNLLHPRCVDSILFGVEMIERDIDVLPSALIGEL
jgi:hypothetical protein